MKMRMKVKINLLKKIKKFNNNKLTLKRIKKIKNKYKVLKKFNNRIINKHNKKM